MTEKQVYHLRITLNGVVVNLMYNTTRRQWIAQVGGYETTYTRAKGDAIIDLLARVKEQTHRDTHSDTVTKG